MDQMTKLALKEALDTIENDNYKKFAKEVGKTIPKYWYSVPASSTGKYHPALSLGEGGLVRHTCAVIKILNYLFGIECICGKFTSTDRDILRIAALMHDTRKSGSQEEYESNKYTKHEHPLLAAAEVQKFVGCGIIPDESIFIIIEAIRRHMGNFCTSNHSSIVLPKPENIYEQLLHIADYLASRKELELKLVSEDGGETADTFIMQFGKYKGMLLSEIIDTDPEYLIWLRDKADMTIREPLKTLIADL